MRNLAILVPLLFLFFVSTVSGQDLAAKIQNLNTLLGSDYAVSNKGKTLIVDGFREGNHVKNNRVNVFELDSETIKYSESENSVSVSCYSDGDGCVVSVLTRERKKKSYRNRLVFGILEKSEGDDVVQALKEVIKSVRD